MLTDVLIQFNHLVTTQGSSIVRMVTGFRGRLVDTKRVMWLQLERNNSVLVCVIL